MGHYIMTNNTKRRYNLSKYSLNIGVPKYIKQVLMDIKEEIYSNTVTFTIHWHQQTELSDRKSKMK